MKLTIVINNLKSSKYKILDFSKSGPSWFITGEREDLIINYPRLSVL